MNNKDKNKSESEKKQLIINGLLSKGYEYSLIKKYLNNSSNK
jgi:SOS response regulatory protein OraA/RecX